MKQLNEKEVEKIYKDEWLLFFENKIGRKLSKYEKRFVTIARRINALSGKHPNFLAYKKIENFTDELNVDWTPTAKSVMSVDFKKPIGKKSYKKLLSYLKSKNITDNGYDLETGQVTLSVSFDQNKPFHKQLEILEFLPYIKNDRIEIFDSELSQFESRFILVEKNGYTVTSFYLKDYFKSNDIHQALKFVYENFPYIRKEKG